MKIRTVEMLSDKLSQELSWRKKELTELKYLIERFSGRGKSGTVLARCGVALLYAHWEGYIKIGGISFLEYLKMQRLRNMDLAENLLTVIIKYEMDKRSQIKKASNINWITDFYLHKTNDRSMIPYKTIIDTESNLSSSVLKEIIWCLGLDYSPYEANEKLLDAKLLGVRNFIAHGEKILIDISDYLGLHDRVIALMDLFRSQLENAAVTKSYLREKQ